MSAGVHRLGLGNSRDGVVSIPTTSRAKFPLLVLLHGAGGSGEGFLRHLSAVTEPSPVVIVAADSRRQTWDAVSPAQDSVLDITNRVLDAISARRRFAGFGPDVAFLDAALARVFQTIAIDPNQITIAGFSDGATYALSLGLSNGDLFRRVIAFSPGFIVDAARRGRPEIFVSHGLTDQILPIDRCSRRIVPALRERGYAVTFREFAGGHEVPEAIANEAMAWASS
jgi:predicted esterase